MKKIYFYIALLMMMMLSSCNDFLNVQPAGQLDEEEQFSDIRGYRDAMYGIYGRMASTDLYGNNLTYGFVDQIGQVFGYENSEVPAYFVGRYDYNNQNVRTIIDMIWGSQFQTISYINNVLKHVDDAKFNHAELAIIKGECFGLRAFLHFDLARLFADNYESANLEKRGLPYSTSFSLENRKLYSLQETYQMILQDLDEAEKLLVNDDNVNVEAEPTSDYMAGRATMFNKYAVAATKARVYYAMGNATEATRYAKQVVDATHNFELKKLTTMTGVKRFPANSELIFGLYNSTLSEDIANMFVSQTARGTFMEGRRDVENLYEVTSFTATSSDIRYSTFYRSNNAANLRTYSFIRLIESETAVSSDPIQGLTLIRLPEMYYILADCLFDTNKEQAVGYLNIVRNSRGLDSVADDKTVNREAFEKELIREIQREMPGEGQVFYALKHFNRSFTDFRGNTIIEPSTDVFVLPWPERELEFGNK